MQGEHQMNIENRLKELGIKLPEMPPKGGIYTPCMEFGNGEKLFYVSGCGPNFGKDTMAGKLGMELTIEQGQEAARRAILNVLAVLEDKIGSLDKVKRVVKILVFVAGTNEFYSQPLVANGASQLLHDVFGTVPSRSAIGTNALPENIPVEIEAIFEIA